MGKQKTVLGDRRFYRLALVPKVHGPKQVWERDRRVLAMFPLLRLGASPSREALARADRARTDRTYTRPHRPIRLTGALVKETRDQLVEQIQNLTGLVFAARVDVHVVPGEEIRRRTGAKREPAAACLPDDAVILFPQQAVYYRQASPADKPLRGPYTREAFQCALAAMLLRALGRQVRGEWGATYEKKLKDLDADARRNIADHLRVVAQLYLEELTIAAHPEWGLETFAFKVPISRDLMDSYTACRDLLTAHQDVGFAEPAQLDGAGSNETRSFGCLHRNHPDLDRRLAELPWFRVSGD